MILVILSPTMSNGALVELTLGWASEENSGLQAITLGTMVRIVLGIWDGSTLRGAIGIARNVKPT